MQEPSGSDDRADILARMEQCLAALDRIGAEIPAAYLATAIEHLRRPITGSGPGSHGDRSTSD